jgi:hypothetical protein
MKISTPEGGIVIPKYVGVSTTCNQLGILSNLHLIHISYVRVVQVTKLIRC